MAYFILADNQDLTRIGIRSLCEGVGDSNIDVASSKKELLQLLRMNENAIIILDYTLFDFVDVSELFILHQRFPNAHWILISDELSSSFSHRVAIESYAFSIVTKNSEQDDINKAIRLAMRRERYICQQVTDQILSFSYNKEVKILVVQNSTYPR